MADSCECGNELSVPIKCAEFLDQLRDCYLFKKTVLHGVRKWTTTVMNVKSGTDMYYKHINTVRNRCLWNICNHGDDAHL